MSDSLENEDLDGLLKKTFTDVGRPAWMNVKGVTLPATYAKYQDVIENFNARDDDVWVCSLPKNGTTWTQELVWCIVNDLNFEGTQVNLWDRFPFFEFSGLMDFEALKQSISNFEISKSKIESIKYVDEMPDPRLIKTHLPYHLLPRDLREGKTRAKIIHVSRNPKDMCISYFHHCVRAEGYSGNFEQFCKLFLGGKAGYLPYWDHLHGYLSQQNNTKIQMLLLKYEDMKADLESVINKVSDFLEKPRLSPEEMEKIIRHLSFDNMKRKLSSSLNTPVRKDLAQKNGDKQPIFFRSGEMDQWRAAMTPELIKKFDEWSLENSKSTENDEIQ